MSNDLEKRIAEKKARLDALNFEVNDLLTQKAYLEVEIRAYEDAWALMNGDKQKANDGVGSIARKPISPIGHSRTRGRRLFSNRWGHILWDASNGGLNQFGIDELMNSATSVGREISRMQVRGQIADYAQNGYVERIVAGRYQLSKTGIDAVKLSLKDTNETNASSELGELQNDLRRDGGSREG